MKTVLDHLDSRKGGEKGHGSTSTFNLYWSVMCYVNLHIKIV